ncbi:hypothetical protein ACFYSF_22900 [Streptomyces canus]
MTHNPRRCSLCGSIRTGFVGMKVRKALPGPRSTSENRGVK